MKSITLLLLLGCISAQSVYNDWDKTITIEDTGNVLLSKSEDTLLQSQWNIPCKSESCFKFLKKLNGGNDWVKDHHDSLDKEGESE